MNTSLEHAILAQLAALNARTDALTAAVEKSLAPDGYIAGDKAAAEHLGLRSRQTFLALMDAQKIYPVRTDRGKLWPRQRLATLRPDPTPFPSNNPAGRWSSHAQAPSVPPSASIVRRPASSPSTTSTTSTPSTKSKTHRNA
jgi:hypothetical protein